MAVGSASWTTQRGSNGGHAKHFGVSDEAFGTDTGTSIGIATGIETTGLAVTGVNTTAIFAGLGPEGTGVPDRTEDWTALAPWEGVTHHAFETDTSGAFGTDNTLGVVSADHILALRNAFSSGLVLLEPSFAPTPSSMPLRDANGLTSTGKGAARVDTNVVLTCQLTGTVFILATFCSYRAITSRGVGVSTGTFGTDTFIAAGFVQTSGLGTTRVVLTFIHVLTSG